MIMYFFCFQVCIHGSKMKAMQWKVAPIHCPLSLWQEHHLMVLKPFRIWIWNWNPICTNYPPKYGRSRISNFKFWIQGKKNPARYSRRVGQTAQADDPTNRMADSASGRPGRQDGGWPGWLMAIYKGGCPCPWTSDGFPSVFDVWITLWYTNNQNVSNLATKSL
jgi:hypothetical protein